MVLYIFHLRSLSLLLLSLAFSDCKPTVVVQEALTSMLLQSFNILHFWPSTLIFSPWQYNWWFCMYFIYVPYTYYSYHLLFLIASQLLLCRRYLLHPHGYMGPTSFILVFSNWYFLFNIVLINSYLDWLRLFTLLKYQIYCISLLSKWLWYSPKYEPTSHDYRKYNYFICWGWRLVQMRLYPPDYYCRRHHLYHPIALQTYVFCNSRLLPFLLQYPSRKIVYKDQSLNYILSLYET